MKEQNIDCGCIERRPASRRSAAGKRNDRPGRPQTREVRDPPEAGPRRHGRRVPGAGHRDRADRGAQADRTQPRRRHAATPSKPRCAAPTCRRAWRTSIRAWCASIDAGDLDGFFYVAMEYIDGQDLAELMRHGPLEVEFAADVALAVARDAGERPQAGSHHRRQGISGHRARRHQAQEHPHRCARRSAGARFRHRQGAFAFAPADAQRIRQRAVRLAGAAGIGRSECGVGPVVAGGDALRNGHRAAAVPRRIHRAAGAHDPLGDSAAARAGPVPAARCGAF